MQSLIKFLGVGGAFNPELGNSSAIVNLNGQNILLDCGYTVYGRICQLGIAKQIDFVLITHLHNDHVGSLSTYIYHYTMIDKLGKLKIIVASKTFEESLRGYLGYSIPHIDDFVDFIELSRFKEIKAYDTYGLHVADYQTYGFEFNINGQRYLYSGDLNDATFVKNVMKPKKDDIIFHEVDFFKEATAHTFYKNLEKHLGHFKVYGYHNNPKYKPSDCQIPLIAERKEFLWGGVLP
ncbi:MAG: ribonuclease Z [Bacteroidia bacterium]